MPPKHPPKLTDRWTITILLAVGAWMIFAAGHYTVFDDEAFSCQRYVLPPGQMIQALWEGVEPDPPLYYLIQNLTLRIAGLGPLGLRAASIVIFLAGLLAMRAAGQAWFGERVGRLAMLLCAAHPAHLFFGFAARWYSTIFLMVALLLWATKRLADAPPATPDRRSRARRWLAVWALLAAATCYTNYFGTVVVALVWLVAFTTTDHRNRWLIAGPLAAAFFAPWLIPFWRQATTFPQFAGSPASIFATAGRTIMALLAGNLASPRAWWVWGPMLVFSILLAIRVWRLRTAIGPIAAIVLGCFLAGTLSRTMIDKYVMTFSGIASLLVAAVLSGTVNASQTNRSRHETIRLAACTTLTLAWIACGFNLVTQRSWSSLRWLDPFPAAIAEAMRMHVPLGQWAISQPAGRYYAALQFAQEKNAGSARDAFTSLAVAPATPSAGSGEPIPNPASMLTRISQTSPPSIITVEAAEFSDSPDWQALREALNRLYELSDEKHYLQDPDAAWKDQIDPRFHHPRWRITVRRWDRKPLP